MIDIQGTKPHHQLMRGEDLVGKMSGKRLGNYFQTMIRQN